MERPLPSCLGIQLNEMRLFSNTPDENTSRSFLLALPLISGRGFFSRIFFTLFFFIYPTMENIQSFAAENSLTVEETQACRALQPARQCPASQLTGLKARAGTAPDLVCNWYSSQVKCSMSGQSETHAKDHHQHLIIIIMGS